MKKLLFVLMALAFAVGVMSVVTTVHSQPAFAEGSGCNGR